MSHLRKLIFWCLLIVLSASALGCNTMRGMGADLERAGEAIQDAFD